MKKTADYTSVTPSFELYQFLAESVIENRISDFSGLLEFAKPISIDEKTSAVFSKIFRLIRKLYWGFFRDIDPDIYPKVWRELVIPHPRFPRCGDLKRNLTISDIYVGILDLHGYTRFCEKNKNNLSMLQILDDLIQVEMAKLARAHDVVLQRRQGDEMVLVGASAVDLVAVALSISEFFIKKGSKETQTKIALPDMHISAGIAGGKKFTPFIITRDGDLSGGVVNTAARLQSRANELSGERSRIVVSRTVFTSYLAETRNGVPECLQSVPLHFFDSGYISFKGIEVAVNEVLFEESDRYKALIEKDMAEVYKAIDAGAWKDSIFVNILILLVRIYKNMEPFHIDAVSNGIATKLTNDNLIRMAMDTAESFKSKQDYAAAVDGLQTLLGYTRTVPGFDRLALEYSEHILERYKKVAAEFETQMNVKLKEKAATTLSAKHRQLYEENRKCVLIQERLNLEMRKALTPLELTQLWNGAVEALKGELELSIYSGKR